MIGVYDSGFGGLSVLRHLRAALPERDFTYFGDSARAPYGGRDVDTLLDITEQAVEHLIAEGCHVIVVACNTVSCVALRHLQRRYAPVDGPRRVLGVAIPGAEAAVAASAGRIGLLATSRTVASHTYPAEIAKLGPHRVTQQAAPLLAPLVEEGWEDTDIARLLVRRYVDLLLEQGEIDTLLLACTHYPLLARQFFDAVPPGVAVVDPAAHTAARLADWLARHPGFDTPGTGALRVTCSGDAAAFARHATRFLGEPVGTVERVHARESPAGQVVRGV